MLIVSVALLPTPPALCKATRLSPRTLPPTTAPVAFLPLLAATALLVVVAAPVLVLVAAPALAAALALVPVVVQDRALAPARAPVPVPVLVLPPAVALVPLHPLLPLQLATSSPSPQRWGFCPSSPASSCYKHFPLQFFIFIHHLGSTYRKGNHVLYHRGSYWQTGLF